MILIDGVPGRLVPCTGVFGARPADFPVGDDGSSPLSNDLPSLTDRASAEWLWVLLTPLPGSGTTLANDLGGYALTGAADGTYTQDYRGLVLALDGSVTVYEAEITVSVGAATSAVTADLSAAYAIHAAVTADLSASYSVLKAVTADLAGSYTIDSSLTAVTADLAGSYAVRQQVTADLAGSYTIDSSTTAVTADLVGAFAILGRLQVDLSGSYLVQSESTPLAAPVFDRTVRAAGIGAADRTIAGTRARRIGQAAH